MKRVMKFTVGLSLVISAILMLSGVSAAFASTGADMPVYRFFNMKNGSHFYTADEAERANVAANLSKTYSYDGVAYEIDTANVNNSARSTASTT